MLLHKSLQENLLLYFSKKEFQIKSYFRNLSRFKLEKVVDDWKSYKWDRLKISIGMFSKFKVSLITDEALEIYFGILV